MKKLKSAVFGFLIMRLKSIIAVKRISIANGMKMQELILNKNLYCYTELKL